MKDQNDNKTVDWVEILAKRQAYNYGIRTPETREACRIYMADLRKRKQWECRDEKDKTKTIRNLGNSIHG